MLRLSCGKLDSSGILRVDRGALEQHGKRSFQAFFERVCRLKHVVEAQSKDPSLDFDPRLSDIVYAKLKSVVFRLLWDPEWASYLEQVFCPVDTESKVDGRLLSLRRQPWDSSLHDNDLRFIAVFAASGTTVVEWSETNFYRLFFTEREIYSAAGVAAATSVDISLASGGPEAIVESFYGVMDSQRQTGGMDNRTLSQRTKLDWVLPDITQCQSIVKEAASLYIRGGKGLKRHYMMPYAENVTVSKVFDRHITSEARLPFLMEDR